MKDGLVHKVLAMYRMKYQPIFISLGRDKVAKTLDQIVSGLDPAIIARANNVPLRKVSQNPLIKQLEYKVGGNDKPQYTVMIRAVPKGDERQYGKSDLLVSCSCRFWRWSGCEYHAYRGDYLYSRENPLGSLSVPEIRDPEGNNFVCKHVYRALQDAKDMYFDMNTFGR